MTTDIGQVRIENIPEEMRRRRQWVLWKYVERGGEKTKVPFQTNGSRAKADDCRTWNTFDAVMDHVAKYEGPGFEFHESDPYVGIDLDGCRQPKTGLIVSWAKEVLDRFNSYSEVSPSETGVKILLKANWRFENGKNRKLEVSKVCEKDPGVECYAQKRYFAVTGHRLDEYSPNIEERQEALDWLVEKYFQTKAPKPSNGRPRHADVNVIERARKYLAQMPPAISGQRGHDRTFEAACRMVIGFDLPKDEAFDLLAEWNQTCQPSWSERELWHKIKDADKQPGERGELLNGRHPREDHPRSSAPIPDLPEPEEIPWPDPLADEAFHGLAGEFVRLIEPHTEADPAALLFQFLVCFGNALGRHSYFAVEADRHYPNLFSVMVGTTCKGRKGTSLGQVLRLYNLVDSDFARTWCEHCIKSGLSSGEGVIWAVRDPIEKQVPIKEKGRIIEYESEIVDHGISDKRLLITESEFAQGLKVMSREGNTLSPVIRNAWDTGRLRSLTKNSPARATDAHVSILGHITKQELTKHLNQTESANGLANRFLWVCCKRSKYLPDGGSLSAHEITPIADRLGEAILFGAQDRQTTRSPEATKIWHAVYPKLSDGRPGLWGAVTSRSEAQVTRLAAIYALLDQSSTVEADHLLAALACWDYADQSARYIFGDSLGDPVADEIRDLLKTVAPEGMTRTDLMHHFNRNRSSGEIGKALQTLEDHGTIERRKDEAQGKGRPATRFYAK